MKTKHILFSRMTTLALFAANAAPSYAGGEDVFGLGIGPNNCYRAGYFRTPVKKGTRCTLSVYNSYGAMDYWIQYHDAGSSTWRNLTSKRTWIDGNGDGQEDIQIRVTRSRAYRLVADFNGNGYPDATTEDGHAIYVK